ncbi:MAG TPA: xanthine dehydrogenase family protein subunit M [Puia sp.]|nr:xanthine dehydrogenase family protein subunit M [Puia sp.]
MYPFTLVRTNDNTSAIKAATENKHSKFIGGGTNLIDLMKMNIEKPNQLIDLNKLALKKIEKLSNGNILIGALVTNSDLAYHEMIRSHFPMLSEAILAGASPQLRNVATTAGNLLQRTRCYYFYDIATPCNKREPGSGCSAINGYNRIHAILGTSDHCIATHPSDMCVAMAALDAVIHIEGINGKRIIKFSDFHTLPEEHPQIENTLQQGELITAVEIPALSFAKNSTYIKVRDRSSFDFALASAAVAIDIDGGIIRNVRIALGGVGTKPWRAASAEKFLIGRQANTNNFNKAADEELKNAKTSLYNSFKKELAKRTLISALQNIGGIS